MDRMSIVDFGDALLRTRDLDPVYVAVASAELDYPTKARLCLAYWCFYSLGTAAYIAEKGKNPRRYWELMNLAAINAGTNPDGSKPWPRGAERRHFRGAQATQAVGELASKYRDAESVLNDWIATSDLTFGGVTAAVQRNRGFGPWIAFKIADMADRVLGYEVDFSNCHLGIYKDPRQGAALARFGDWQHPIADAELEETVETYVRLWRKKRAKAPPHNDRLVNVQEIETIFCKYKSHVKGHYPLGKDTREVHHGLEGWGDLAQQLQKGLPHGTP